MTNMVDLGVATFRTKVAEEVKRQLGTESWLKGVCMDGIEEFINTNDFEGAVSHAYNETFYWDSPYNL